MKKKIKLFSTIATLCLSLAMMAFGVYSALTVTYKAKGTITYDIADTYVEIETRVYSLSKKYDTNSTLETKSKEFENSNFTALDALTATGIVEGDVTHDFKKVQIKNTDKGEDYTVQDSDYKDTYSSVTSMNAPDDLQVALKYKTAQGTDKGVYTYFVVTKLVNKSAVPLYAYVPDSGSDKYVAPENSNYYKMADNYKELATLNSEVYIVFSMSLDDITKAINESNFVYPIVVTKDASALPENPEDVQKEEHIAKYEVAKVEEQETRTALSASPTVVNIPFLTLTTAELDYMLINFHIKQTEQTLPANIQLNFSISAVMGTMACTSFVKDVVVFERQYTDISEAFGNLGYALTITKSSGTDTYTVSIPSARFTNDGTSNFTMIVQTEPYGLADMLYEAGFTDVQYSITSSIDNLEIITFNETVEWEITDYYKIGKAYTRETKNEDILQKLGFAYTLYNYQIRRLESGTQKLNFGITSNNAEAMFIIPGVIRHDLTINEIYAMSNNSEIITAGVLNNQAQANLPITLNDSDVMNFCVCILYNAEQVKNGQDVSVTLSTAYELTEEETSNLNYILAVDDNGKLFYDVVGMIDETQNMVTIPAYHNNIPVTLIDDEVFMDNQNITAVVFEDNSNVTKLGYSAFQNCINLQTLNFGQNAKLKQIDREAFAGCSKLETVIMPNSVKSVDHSVFEGCSKLSSVTLSNNLEILSSEAFKDCIGLTEIEIPESVTKINSDVFKGCINLAAIEIGNSVTDIIYTAFNETPWYTTNVINGVHTNKSGTKYALRLPEGETTFDFTGIKVIGGSFALYEVSTLTTITNISSVEYISGSAFNGCKTLQNFDFGATSKLKGVGQMAFRDCDALTTVSIPYGIETLWTSTFYGCDNLKTVTLPNSLKTIDNSAFWSCTALTNITIPESVTTIGGVAFGRCSSLTNIDLPSSISRLGGNIFEDTPIETQLASTDGIYTNSQGVKYAIALPVNCSSEIDFTNVRVIADDFAAGNKSLSILRNMDDVVYIGSDAFRNAIIDGLLLGKNAKLEAMGDYAFFGCKYLFILVLPKTLTYMGYASVYEHEYLDKVYYGSTQEDFEKIEKKDDLFVLDTATIYYYSETEPTSEGNYWRYVDNIPTAW